jgi:hypothetical protein
MQVETQEKSLILRMREDPSLFRGTHKAAVPTNSPHLKDIQVRSQTIVGDFLVSCSSILMADRGCKRIRAKTCCDSRSIT